MTTNNLFTRHGAEQADHERVIVRKADAEEILALVDILRCWGLALRDLLARAGLEAVTG